MKHIAVIGAGRIGRIHATHLAALPDARLVAVSDPNAVQAHRLAADVDCAVASIDAVLSDPLVDAVVIAAPTALHGDLIERAADAGKHVFCEKPVDLSVARAEACARAVRDRNVACMIGFQRRFDPGFAAIQAEVASGAIGTPELLTITSGDPAPPPLDYLPHSGGLFRDMLIHDFDVFRWLLAEQGEDEAVWLSATGTCLVDPAIGEAGDIDTAMVLIRTRSGRLCRIAGTRRSPVGYDQRFEVLGSSGHRIADNPVVIDTRPEDPFFVNRYRAAYRAEMLHFIDCLHTGAPVRCSVADGLAAQRLADAAALSHAQGTPVSLPA